MSIVKKERKNMKAEVENISNEIKQSLELLRRHL
jgi:hypothetical protein